MNFMEIFFIRHGKTEYNEQCKVMGHIDAPLSESGQLEAEKLAEKLKNEKFDVIFCSPLLRAKQTARAVNEYQRCPIFFDKRLIERDCGKLSGITYAELDELKPNWSWVIGDNRCEQLNVETVEDMMKRVQDFANYVNEEWSDSKVLVVAHSGIASVFHALQDNLKKGDDILNIHIPNAKLLHFNVQSTDQATRE